MRFIKLTLAAFNTPVCINVSEIASYTTPAPQAPKSSVGDTKTIIVMNCGDMVGVTEDFDTVDKLVRLGVH